MDATDAEKFVSAIFGKPAWSAKRGHGSFLTFEFGEPSLEIVEPKVSEFPVVNNGERESRRRIKPVGEWHLWIYCCNWEITVGDTKIVNSDQEHETIDAALVLLDGQILTSVFSAGSQWIFDFDLNSKLISWPYECNSQEEQWLLYNREQKLVCTAFENKLVGPHKSRMS